MPGVVSAGLFLLRDEFKLFARHVAIVGGKFDALFFCEKFSAAAIFINSVFEMAGNCFVGVAGVVFDLESLVGNFYLFHFFYFLCE